MLLEFGETYLLITIQYVKENSRIVISARYGMIELINTPADDGIGPVGNVDLGEAAAMAAAEMPPRLWP